MSWDRSEYKEISLCACGKGKIVRWAYIEGDDWNRTRSGIISEEICCNDCKEKFHIEHYTRHYFCLPWKDDGIIDRVYLVPNNLSIPSELSEKKFCFCIQEQIVAEYSLKEILAVRADMIQSKYSTRLERKSSQKVVELYAKRYKKKRLAPIIEMLRNIESQYDTYEWTPQRIEEFRRNEKIQIQENKRAIDIVLSQSFELDFRRALDD